MAGFEGTRWAGKQMLFLLNTKSYELHEADAKVYAVSKSIHYGLFLAFEGIRFFCKKNAKGRPALIFLNLKKNLQRFRRGISFNLSTGQQNLVPGLDELTHLFLRYFREPEMMPFLNKMSDSGAQGYLRPFTVDENQSIGVTFPENPSIRAIAVMYDRYLGEPFSGVVIPNMVRASGVNGTGSLKLGINYLMSIKAVDAAKALLPGAASALFLDDRPYDPLETRKITEWDSSCCMLALRSGTIIKIPESPLILPSVTIGGISTILKKMKVPVEERDVTYGELIDWTRTHELTTICSVGTAGIMNRAQKLLLTDGQGNTIDTHIADESHSLYRKLREARTYYWDIYREKVPAPEGMERSIFTI